MVEERELRRFALNILADVLANDAHFLALCRERRPLAAQDLIDLDALHCLQERLAVAPFRFRLLACGFFLCACCSRLLPLCVARDERVKIFSLLLVAGGKERPYALATLLAQSLEFVEQAFYISLRKEHRLSVVNLHLDVNHAILIGVFQRLLFLEKGVLRVFLPGSERLAALTRLLFRRETLLLQILLFRCKLERLICKRRRLQGAARTTQSINVGGERCILRFKIRQLHIRLMRLLSSRHIDDADPALFLLRWSGRRRRISKEKERAAKSRQEQDSKSAANFLPALFPKAAALRLFLRHRIHLPKSPCI